MEKVVNLMKLVKVLSTRMLKVKSKKVQLNRYNHILNLIDEALRLVHENKELTEVKRFLAISTILLTKQRVIDSAKIFNLTFKEEEKKVYLLTRTC